MTKEMEALADKICKEELGQEPNENNVAFRKTLVHGMVRWDEQSKVKKFHKPLVMRPLPDTLAWVQNKYGIADNELEHKDWNTKHVADFITEYLEDAKLLEGNGA